MRTRQIIFMEKLANTFEALAIIAILVLALNFQFVLHELPCPLCLLQRVGFYCVLFGFLLNLRYGFHPFHYSIAILSALFTAFIALRQIALHVVPGTGHYGSPFLGLHLYTWTFIASMIIVIVTTLLFGIERQYQPYSFKRRTNALIHVLFLLICVTLLINIASVFLQCGMTACPDNPEVYKLVTH